LGFRCDIGVWDRLEDFIDFVLGILLADEDAEDVSGEDEDTEVD